MERRKRRSRAELLVAIDRVFQGRRESNDDAISRLYGHLPYWVPEPVHSQIRQHLDSLRNAGQSAESIAKFIAMWRAEKLESPPGSVLDVGDFFKSVAGLARVQWALSLGKARAIRELAGRDSELGNRLRLQRQKFSNRGNASKRKNAATRAGEWLKLGEPIRAQHPDKPNSWVAREIARKSGYKESTIRATMSPRGPLKSLRVKKQRNLTGRLRSYQSS